MVYRRSTWTANFSPYPMLKSNHGNVDWERAGASCVQLLSLCGTLTLPGGCLLSLFCAAMWVNEYVSQLSSRPPLGWTESGAQLEGRFTVKRRGEKKQIKNRLRTGRQRWKWAEGWRHGGGGGAEEEEGMCRCMLTHKDENPPQQWPLDYIRAWSQLVHCPQEL